MATEKAYMAWIRRYILFHGKRHPAEMEKLEIQAFLSHLAVNRAVSPATQNQALQAILFLYRNVLEIKLPWLNDVIRAKPKRRMPVVLSQDETMALLKNMPPAQYLLTSLMYGSRPFTGYGARTTTNCATAQTRCYRHGSTSNSCVI
jgi:site-specific recombinase XerD